MPRHDKVKINGAHGQTGGKNRSSTFVLTAFISFGLFNLFRAKGKCQKLSPTNTMMQIREKTKAKCETMKGQKQSGKEDSQGMFPHPGH
jgi:hypothetical protein